MTKLPELPETYPFELDSLPAGWRWAMVGDVTNEIRSGFASGKHNAQGTGIPHLRPMNVSRLGQVDLTEVKYVAPDSDYRRLRDGDVLFNNTNSPALVGKTAVVTGANEWAFSNHMTRIRTGENLDSTFLALQLHFLWQVGFFKSICVNHVNQASISVKTLSQAVPVVIPPLEVQQQLVEATQDLLSRLQAAEHYIETATARLPATRKAHLASVFDRFSKRLELQELVEPNRPICYGILKPRTSGNLEVPYVEVRSIRGDHIDLDHVPLTTPELHEEFARSELREGDVVVAVRGSYDRAAVVPAELEGANVSRDVARVSPRKSMDSIFLARFLASPDAQTFFRSHARGVGVTGINIGDLRRLPTPVAPLDKQQAAVEDLEARLELTDRLRVDLAAAKRKAGQLRSSILAAAFSGRLTSQEAVHV